MDRGLAETGSVGPNRMRGGVGMRKSPETIELFRAPGSVPGSEDRTDTKPGLLFRVFTALAANSQLSKQLWGL